ncbi:hypothetical protein PR202_gb11374 [Eleusine coracana subsp. coracana]|uniref:Uncharacterized protein n=1 Tax=Eleusine coracana subsp. coracana TaxID=191504 RepID=A0AAV5ELY1_ELECO|nr:hypothetical protein PR202_gb11374 [Eleusine coracana subsp. coracana]
MREPASQSGSGGNIRNTIPLCFFCKPIFLHALFPFPDLSLTANIWYQIHRSMEPYRYHYSGRPKSDESFAAIDAVNPNLQFVLAELQKMEIRLGDHVDGRCSGLERRVDEAEQRAETRFITLEMAQTEFDHWKPHIEKKVEDVKLEVSRITAFLERTSLEKPNHVGILPGSMSERPSAGFNVDGPSGHRVERQLRDHEFGEVYTPYSYPGQWYVQSFCQP